MRMKRLLATVPALAAQAFYAIGHAVVGTFLANTRIVGIRDSHIKEPLIAANVIGWPLVGLASAFPDFGFWILDFGFLRTRHQSKIQNPKSKIAGWLWRVAFTVIG